MRVDLPDGNWAELIDPDDLTLGDIIEIKNSVKVAVTGGGASRNGRPDPDAETRTEMGTGMAEQLEAATLARIVSSWSLPMPVNRPSVLRLKRSQLRELRKHIAPYIEVVRGDDDDPNSPSGSETASV